jgi:AcrR family transcriptional regulator
MKKVARPDKRQKILTAAVALFRRTHNVKKVSLESIAREARVSPTTIYNHFGTREALLNEVTRALLHEILEMARSFINTDLPFPQKLTEIIAGKLDIASQVNSEVLTKLVSQDNSMTDFIEEVYRAEVKPLWLDFIADGKRQGYIDASLDDASLILYLNMLRAGLATQPWLTRDLENNMPLLEQLTRLMFYGFLKKDIDLFKKEENESHD